MLIKGGFPVGPAYDEFVRPSVGVVAAGSHRDVVGPLLVWGGLMVAPPLCASGSPVHSLGYFTFTASHASSTVRTSLLSGPNRSVAACKVPFLASRKPVFAVK